MSLVLKIKKAYARKKQNSFMSGDTMVEVMFGITTFSLISILAATIMNLGISTAQANLEQTMARELINSQAEAIRYIHEAYIAEHNNLNEDEGYNKLWKEITFSGNSTLLSATPLSLQVNNCGERYSDVSTVGSIFRTSSFIINTRSINPDDITSSVFQTNGMNASVFKQASLQPRLIFANATGDSNEDDNISERGKYTKLTSAEGIWVTPAASGSTSAVNGQPEFYDFYIQTCWYAPGQSHTSTLGTVIRLYNPDFVK